MSTGVVPNPHWWKQKPVVYYYRGGLHPLAWSHFAFWFVVLTSSIVAPKAWAFRCVVGAILLLIGAFLEWYVGEQGGGRIETRFRHITFFKNDKILLHESMRDLVSLKPVMKREKLWYYEAVFWNGETLKIYSSLTNLDELLTTLQSHSNSIEKP